MKSDRIPSAPVFMPVCGSVRASCACQSRGHRRSQPSAPVSTPADMGVGAVRRTIERRRRGNGPSGT
eukprot:10199268-Lingulodinium_polyedra.AAC.1